MQRARDAYRTTTGSIAVRDDTSFKLWVLKEGWLGDSRTVEGQCEKAVKLFDAGMMEAFERYDENLHGRLQA